MQPLINDLEHRIDQLATEAMEQGSLNETKIFADAPFNKRLALLTEATGHEMFFAKLKGKQFKTSGMFALRTYPGLLDMVESIIGPEIMAHQQYSLRPKLPGASGAVGWHQDNTLLSKDGWATLVANCSTAGYRCPKHPERTAASRSFVAHTSLASCQADFFTIHTRAPMATYQKVSGCSVKCSRAMSCS
jgi:hypothetical protein